MKWLYPNKPGLWRTNGWSWYKPGFQPFMVGCIWGIKPIFQGVYHPTLRNIVGQYELILWFITINVQQKRKIVYWETVFFQLWFHDSPNFTVSHQKWNSFVPSLQWAESFISLIKKWHSFVPFNPFDWVLVLRVLGACVSLLHTSWWRSFHLPEKKGARRLEGGDTVWPAPRRNHQNSGYCMILLGCEFEFPWKRHKLPSGKLT